MCGHVVRPRRSSGRARGSRAAASRGTSISRAQSSGTRSKPMRRAASAGNSALRSFVAVKMQLTNCSDLELVALHQLAHQLLVAARIASALLRSTLVAPRSANSRMRGDCVRAPRRAAAHLGVAQAPVRARARARRARAGRSATRCEREHRVPDRLAHPPHLALAALADRSSISCAPTGAPARAPSARPRARRPSRRRRSAAVADRPAADARAVGLRHLVARMRQQVGELAVVGQQDQAGAVGVEAPDRIQARAAGRRPGERRSAGRGCRARSRRRRRACAARRRTRRSAPGERAPVDAHALSLADVARRIEHALAVDAHAPGGDQLLGGAARGDAGVGEVLGEAHAAATIGRHGPATLLDEDARRRTASRATAPARCGRGWRAARHLRRDDRPAGVAARGARSRACRSRRSRCATRRAPATAPSRRCSRRPTGGRSRPC